MTDFSRLKTPADLLTVKRVGVCSSHPTGYRTDWGARSFGMGGPQVAFQAFERQLTVVIVKTACQCS